MDKLLALDPGLAIWTVISFLFFLLLLWKLAWGPILQALDRREKRIDDAIASAEKAREDGEQILARQKEELAKARDEARAIVNEATSDAGKRGEEIVLQARQESEKLLERARREIKSEEVQAVSRVRQEAVDIALDAAGRLLGRTISGDDHRRMVENFIAEMNDVAGEKEE